MIFDFSHTLQVQGNAKNQKYRKPITLLNTILFARIPA
jgi:hypothetical protein